MLYGLNTNKKSLFCLQDVSLWFTHHMHYFFFFFKSLNGKHVYKIFYLRLENTNNLSTISKIKLFCFIVFVKYKNSHLIGIFFWTFCLFIFYLKKNSRLNNILVCKKIVLVSLVGTTACTVTMKYVPTC